MEEYINELIQIGLGNAIDLSADKYIVKDEAYQENMKNAGNTLDKFRDGLSGEMRTLFEEYMDYIMNANERACILSYLAGAENVIKYVKR